MKQKTFGLRVAGVLFLCFVQHAVGAQEFIREALWHKDATSIVREIDARRWLVCNNYDGRTSFACFDMSGTVWKMQDADWPYSYVVKDFEVVDSRYVYYCGTMVINQTWILGPDGSWTYQQPEWGAMIGYFDMAEFPAPSTYGVHTLIDRGFVSLDKLEVYFEDGYVHLAMVGSKIDSDRGGSKTSRESCVLDASGQGLFPNSWVFSYAVNEDGEVFDDVAVSRGHVVVTSRIPGRETYFRSFSRAPAGGAFMNYPVAAVSTAVSADDTVLIDYCEEEYFAVATTNLSSQRIEVAAFDNQLNIYHALSFPLTTLTHPDCSLRDIRYNPYFQSLALLERVWASGVTGSIIHHVDINNAPPLYSPYVYGNKYDGETLSSLDYLRGNPGQMIASGKNDDVTFTRVYRNRPKTYEGCTIENKAICERLKMFAEPISGIVSRNVEFPSDRVRWVVDSWPEIVICGQ